jgi:hypothetical protein
MKFCIASHQRLKQINKKTLLFLSNNNVEAEDIYIFVSPSSYEEYKNYFKESNLNIILSKDSITAARNHIIEYFDNGTEIVELDDDVEDIQTTQKNVKNTSINNFKDLCKELFKLSDKGLWGINANHNNYFATNNIRKGLYSIINSCCGYTNDKDIKLTVQEKEDFDRVCQFYHKGKTVIKDGRHGVKTKYWTNKGGIQAKYNREDRVKVQKKSAEDLMKKWPQYCSTRTRKNGIVDIRFKRMKTNCVIYDKNIVKEVLNNIIDKLE